MSWVLRTSPTCVFRTSLIKSCCQPYYILITRKIQKIVPPDVLRTYFAVSWGNFHLTVTSIKCPKDTCYHGFHTPEYNLYLLHEYNWHISHIWLNVLKTCQWDTNNCSLKIPQYDLYLLHAFNVSGTRIMMSLRYFHHMHEFEILCFYESLWCGLKKSQLHFNFQTCIHRSLLYVSGTYVIVF